MIYFSLFPSSRSLFLVAFFVPVCFSDDIMENLSLYLLTWNVATKEPNDNLRLALDIPTNKSSLPDFYVIGLQEVKSQPQNIVMDSLFDNDWTNAFRYVLVPNDYVKIKSVRMVGLVLIFLSLRKHVTHIREIQMESTKTGVFGLWGNKGAVTIRLKIYGCSFCFVNSHLAPHDHALKDRIEDFHTILNDQKFESKDASKIMSHDYVFWFGDLNFRISDPEHYFGLEIERQINDKDYQELLEKDQLREVMYSGEAFSELKEGKITFPPTYRFHLNSERYDLKRRPAWTDRILYKVNDNLHEDVKLELEQNSYQSIPSYGLSDHKPVASKFAVKVDSNCREKQVEFIVNSQWFVEAENCARILYYSDVRPLNTDWIGVFHDNFTSLEDYISYSYVPNSNEDDQLCRTLNSANKTDPVATASGEMPPPRLEIDVIFSDTLIREPGSYRLIYFTKNSHNILGMSSPIHIGSSTNPGSSKGNLDW